MVAELGHCSPPGVWSKLSGAAKLSNCVENSSSPRPSKVLKPSLLNATSDSSESNRFSELSKSSRLLWGPLQEVTEARSNRSSHMLDSPDVDGDSPKELALQVPLVFQGFLSDGMALAWTMTSGKARSKKQRISHQSTCVGK